MRSTRAFLTAVPATGRPVAMPDALDFQLAAMAGADVSAVQPGEPRDVLAREHYFKSWDAAYRCGRSVDPRFEAAADAIVDLLGQPVPSSGASAAHSRSAPAGKS